MHSALRIPHLTALQGQGFGGEGAGGSDGTGVFIAQKHDNLTNRPLSALAHDVRHRQTRPLRRRADFLLQLLWHDERVRLRHIGSLYRPELFASPRSERRTIPTRVG